MSIASAVAAALLMGQTPSASPSQDIDQQQILDRLARLEAENERLKRRIEEIEGRGPEITVGRAATPEPSPVQAGAPFTMAATQAPENDSWSGLYGGFGVSASYISQTWQPLSFGNRINSGTPADRFEFTTHAARPEVFIGQNWVSTDGWVMGLEGRVAWSETDDYWKILNGNQDTGDRFGIAMTGEAEARARIGRAISSDMLVYVSVGVAASNLDTFVRCTFRGFAVRYCPDRSTLETHHSDLNLGYSLGGGLEANLTNNWAVRLDYRYTDYGNHRRAYLPTIGSQVGNVFVDVPISTSAIAVGAIYRFQ